MQKLLIEKYGNCLLYDTDTNSVSYNVGDDIEVRSIFFAELDGQAISEYEVVDYKKGDLLLVLCCYRNEKYLQKIVVCSDMAAKDDLSRWIQLINEQENTDEAI